MRLARWFSTPTSLSLASRSSWRLLQRVTVPQAQQVGGHQKGDLGLSMTSRYAGREALEAKAACVMAVKLPQ
jgi:hypothetical protein